MKRMPIVPCILVWTIATTGCALPQYVEDRYFEKQGVLAVHSSRYEGDKQSRIHRLWIDLKMTEAFEIRFPDGNWVNSKEITAQTLDLHGMETTNIGQRNIAVWHPPFTLGALTGRHQYIRFDLIDKDNVGTLELGACGWTFNEVLRKKPGTRSLEFPITLEDLEYLFGPPSRIESIPLLTGHSCF